MDWMRRLLVRDLCSVGFRESPLGRSNPYRTRCFPWYGFPFPRHYLFNQVYSSMHIIT